ncbi:unnamed protein product, partial [Linum tenue]
MNSDQNRFKLFGIQLNNFKGCDVHAIKSGSKNFQNWFSNCES